MLIFFFDVDRKGTPTAQFQLPTAYREEQQLYQKPDFIDEKRGGQYRLEAVKHCLRYSEYGRRYW